MPIGMISTIVKSVPSNLSAPVIACCGTGHGGSTGSAHYDRTLRRGWVPSQSQRIHTEKQSPLHACSWFGQKIEVYAGSTNQRAYPFGCKSCRAYQQRDIFLTDQCRCPTVEQGVGQLSDHPATREAHGPTCQTLAPGPPPALRASNPNSRSSRAW